MTFDENYGELPKALLALLKKHNVSPADYDMMQEFSMTPAGITQHVKANLINGEYYMPFPFEG